MLSWGPHPFVTHSGTCPQIPELALFAFEALEALSRGEEGDTRESSDAHLFGALDPVVA